VIAGDRDGRPGSTDALRVTADDLDDALSDLLDTRNQMTRAVLGFRADEPG
jgi:chorismate mutase